MKCFLKTSLMLILLLLPIYANTPLENVECMNNAKSVTEFLDCMGEYYTATANAVTDSQSTTQRLLYGPLLTPAVTVMTGLADMWDWFETMVRFSFILTLFVVSQILIIKLWGILFKSILKIYLIYKIMTAPNSDIGDLIELASKGKAEISDKLRTNLTKGKKGIMTVAKLFAILG